MDSCTSDDNNDGKQLTKLTPVSLTDVKRECTVVKVLMLLMFTKAW